MLSDLLGLVPDGSDLGETVLEFVDHHFGFDVLCFVIVQFILDAHSMECVLARKNVEFPIKNGLKAKITHLTWINGDMFVLLLSLLLSQ